MAEHITGYRAPVGAGHPVGAGSQILPQRRAALILVIVSAFVCAGAQAAAVCENLAPAAYATASSEFLQQGGCWSPEMAVDGDLDTRWTPAAGDQHPWIALHWVQPRDVRFVLLTPLPGSVSEVDIEISIDAVTWTKVNQSPMPVLTGPTLLRIPLTSTAHLRVHVVSSAGPSAGIREIAVYSGDAANLAVNAAVEASSLSSDSGQDHRPNTVLDSLPDTRWNAAAGDRDQWLAFHWDEDQTIQMVRFRQFSDRIRTYRIETSYDGGLTWTRLGDPLVDLPASPGPALCTVVLPRFSTRHLRIRAIGLSAEGAVDGSSICDVEIGSEPDTDNKAVFAAVTASGSSAGSSPALVVDGNFDTWWTSPAASGWSAETGAWLRLNWPTPQSFTRVAWEGEGVQTYRLDASPDGSAAAFTPITAELPASASTNDTALSEPVEAKALQLSIVSATEAGGTQGVKVSEIRVFGEDARNKALAADTVASSTFADDPAYGAPMATDGRPETRWNSSGGNGAWVRLGWTQPVTFSRIMWSQALTGRIVRYRLETSPTGADGAWTPITQDLPAVQGENEAALPSAVTARYLRLRVIGATPDASQNGVSIEEMSVTNDAPGTSDVANRALLSRTTAKNSVPNDPAFVPDRATDGDSSTCWNAAPGGSGDVGCWIALNWDQPETISKVAFTQAATRILSFRLEESQTGLSGDYTPVTGMVEAVSGTNVVMLPAPVVTKHLRLYVLNADASGQALGVSIQELRAYDAPDLSSPVSSPGQARALPDGTHVRTTVPLVAEGVPGRLYVQSQDRSAGIACDQSGAGIPAGALLDLRGTVSMLDGERTIVSPRITVWSDSVPLRPVAVSAKSWLTPLMGATCDGLLCTVCGRVVSQSPLVLDDGTGTAITIDPRGAAVPAQVGDFVRVTGAAGRAIDGIAPVLRMRTSADLVIVDE